MNWALRIVLGVVAGLVAAWICLLITLLVVRPRGGLVREAVRLLPDTLVLLKNLARDRTLPRGIRTRLWLLFGYLALPFDFIPDFIPVLGYADDAILVVLVLRSVVRKAGAEAVRRHWSGTPDGLETLWRLAGLAGS